jgi:two-component system response regulator
MSENGTILLVDDSPDDVELTLRALMNNGAKGRVDVVKDGAEALDYLLCRGEYSKRDRDDIPDMVLLDLKMPRVDGLEVLRQLRADDRTRVMPVIVLTSSQDETDRKEAYRQGANSFIRKPTDFDEYATMIGKVERYWRSLNEPPPRI